MNFALLQSFTNQAYFNQGSIQIIASTFYYDQGHEVHTYSDPVTIKVNKVLVPINTKDLADLGLGEYAEDSTFSLFVRKALKFPNGTLLQNGDLVVYKNEKYKIISCLDYSTHQFYKYVITKFKETTLND